MQIVNQMSNTVNGVMLRTLTAGTTKADVNRWLTHTGEVKQGESTTIWPIFYKTLHLSADWWLLNLTRGEDFFWMGRKMCNLERKDHGRLQTVTVYDDKIRLEFDSGGCDAKWGENFVRD